MRPSGMPASMASWNLASVAAIILLWKGPHAIVFDLLVEG